MKITQITVTAGRTFNHPFERYANFRFDFRLQAELSEEDDPAQILTQLQRQAEDDAERHKIAIVKECHRAKTARDAKDHLYQLKVPIPEWSKETPEQRKEALEAAQKIYDEAIQVPRWQTEALNRDKDIHPGHPDHPETDLFDADYER